MPLMDIYETLDGLGLTAIYLFYAGAAFVAGLFGFCLKQQCGDDAASRLKLWFTIVVISALVGSFIGSGHETQQLTRSVASGTFCFIIMAIGAMKGRSKQQGEP